MLGLAGGSKASKGRERAGTSSSSSSSSSDEENKTTVPEAAALAAGAKPDEHSSKTQSDSSRGIGEPTTADQTSSASQVEGQVRGNCADADNCAKARLPSSAFAIWRTQASDLLELLRATVSDLHRAIMPVVH